MLPVGAASLNLFLFMFPIFLGQRWGSFYVALTSLQTSDFLLQVGEVAIDQLVYSHCIPQRGIVF
jgi:hypothetical protein